MPEEVLDSPGSVNEFAEKNNLVLKEVLGKYTVALTEFRNKIAAKRDIKPDELHHQQLKTEEED